ncbi:MAG: hypothetical protein HUU38_25310 [Anaerolineales bacterium]|nr:hypothetical protein [Anaerolineales bacterium]
MAECECLKTCLFFNDKMADIPTTAKMMKTRYCLGDKHACARYMVKSSGKPVPSDLFPNMTEKAKAIIAAGIAV